MCSGGSRADAGKCTREGKLPLWKRSVMLVLYRPGMMVGDVAIDMGSLISVGMMGLRKAESVVSRNRATPRM